MYLYFWSVCEREREDTTLGVSPHLSPCLRGGLFASGPLCPIFHLPSPCLSCWVRLLNGFWGLKSRSSLHSKRFYPVSQIPSPQTQIWCFLYCEGAVRWQCHECPESPKRRPSSVSSPHWSRKQNCSVIYATSDKGRPSQLTCVKGCIRVKTCNTTMAILICIQSWGTNRNFSDYDLLKSKLIILSCFYTGLKLRKWKYAKSHWKEEKTLKATGTCWLLQALGTEESCGGFRDFLATVTK